MGADVFDQAFGSKSSTGLTARTVQADQQLCLLSPTPIINTDSAFQSHHILFSVLTIRKIKTAWF